MNIENLLEEFLTSFKMNYMKKTEMVEIFINPTWKEIKEASSFSGDVRFIATLKPNKFYVFRSDVLHSFVKDYIKENKKISVNSSKVVLHGVGEIFSNRISPFISGTWFYKMDEDISSAWNIKKWIWLEKYKVDIYVLKNIFNKIG